MRKNEDKFDFKQLGLAIKTTRKKRGYTREYVAAKIDIDPRHLANIENSGQHPSLQVFYELVTLLNLSVDEFFLPSNSYNKSSTRLHIEKMMDGFDKNELSLMEALGIGIENLESK